MPAARDVGAARARTRPGSSVPTSCPRSRRFTRRCARRWTPTARSLPPSTTSSSSSRAPGATATSRATSRWRRGGSPSPTDASPSSSRGWTSSPAETRDEAYRRTRGARRVFAPTPTTRDAPSRSIPRGDEPTLFSSASSAVTRRTRALFVSGGSLTPSPPSVPAPPPPSPAGPRLRRRGGSVRVPGRLRPARRVARPRGRVRGRAQAFPPPGGHPPRADDATAGRTPTTTPPTTSPPTEGGAGAGAGAGLRGLRGLRPKDSGVSAAATRPRRCTTAAARGARGGRRLPVGLAVPGRRGGGPLGEPETRGLLPPRVVFVVRERRAPRVFARAGALGRVQAAAQRVLEVESLADRLGVVRVRSPFGSAASGLDEFEGGASASARRNADEQMRELAAKAGGNPHPPWGLRPSGGEGGEGGGDAATFGDVAGRSPTRKFARTTTARDE